MDNRELALFIAEFLDSRKGEDIAVIDIAEKSGFADYFVICTAASIRQMQAMSGDLEDKLAEKDVLVHHVEGKGESGWILMDFGDLIVNLFTAEQRNHYNIDKIWGDCVKLDFEPKKQ